MSTEMSRVGILLRLRSVRKTSPVVAPGDRSTTRGLSAITELPGAIAPAWVAGRINRKAASIPARDKNLGLAAPGGIPFRGIMLLFRHGTNPGGERGVQPALGGRKGNVKCAAVRLRLVSPAGLAVALPRAR